MNIEEFKENAYRFPEVHNQRFTDERCELLGFYLCIKDGFEYQTAVYKTTPILKGNIKKYIIYYNAECERGKFINVGTQEECYKERFTYHSIKRPQGGLYEKPTFPKDFVREGFVL